MKRNVGIAGRGFYVPEKVVTNKELEKYMDTTDEWIQEKLGIKERRMADKDQAFSDLAYPAALSALENAGINADDVDLIIVCAINQDRRAPSTAAILQKKLNAVKSAAFDVNVGGCPGSCYSLVIAQQFIENGTFDNVLVVTGDIYSKLVDISDRETAVFFGDGAGAAVLRPCVEGKGFLSSLIGADGIWGSEVIVCEGGSRVPYTKEAIEDKRLGVRMDSREVWKFGTKIFPNIIRTLASKAEKELEELEWIIPHQANINMIKFGMNELGLPMSKTYTNLHKYANTGAGSVMIALAEAVNNGIIQPGQLVALASFGAGFSWGGVCMDWCDEEDFI